MVGIDLLSCVRSLPPNHHHFALFLLSLYRWPRDDKPYSTACRNAKVNLRQISNHLEKFQQPSSYGHLNFFLYLCVSLIFWRREITFLWFNSSTHSGSFITTRVSESKIFIYVCLKRSNFICACTCYFTNSSMSWFLDSLRQLHYRQDFGIEDLSVFFVEGAVARICTYWNCYHAP